ncbi:MAG TPA: aminoacyl-tRNA hydrolase [Planctomycetota bacterium]|nr:aminoacyl-tRNA hydrolase [Planctomycetota bacterium]
MRCVLGIGNPGREYERTRHNCGFLVIDELARRHGVGSWSTKWKAHLAEIGLGDQRVLLIKPQTYVNLSGEAAQAVLAFYKLAPADLLVIVDDINLALGDLRLRPSGSAGGHNGLKDIEARIGQAYPRLRVGIGAPTSAEAQIGHVLGGFAPDEQADAQAMIAKAADCAEGWVRDGVSVSCRFNGPLRPPPPRVRPPKATPADGVEPPPA